MPEKDYIWNKWSEKREGTDINLENPVRSHWFWGKLTLFICVLAMPVVVTGKIQLQINDRQIAVPTVLFVYCVVGFPYFRPHPKQPRKHRRVEAFSFWLPILAQSERNKIKILLRSKGDCAIMSRLSRLLIIPALDCPIFSMPLRHLQQRWIPWLFMNTNQTFTRNVLAMFVFDLHHVKHFQNPTQATIVRQLWWWHISAKMCRMLLGNHRTIWILIPVSTSFGTV